MGLLQPPVHMLSVALSGSGAASLCAALWRATWQGAVLIAGVYAICKVARRLPTAIRCWLWWLACLKMLIALCLVTIPLAVLPASSPLGRSLASTLPAHARLYLPVSRVSAHKPILAQPEARIKAQPVSAATDPAPVAAAVVTPQRLSIPLWSLSLALWVSGVAALAVRSLLALLLAGRLISRSAPANDTDLSLADEMAERLSVRRLPRVVQSSHTSSLFVIGLFRPTIVLPRAKWSRFTEDETRMALAHEMAHLRRADLWGGLIPAMARLLFFFHPLVWLAAREYSACREEACDLLALRATGLSAAGYGELLVKMATKSSQPGLAHAAGLSSAYRAVRRRLETIAANAKIPQSLRPGARLALSLTLAVLCALLLPWRLVAAKHAPMTSQSAAPAFVMSDLGTVGAGQIASVAMNDQGQVVATAQTQDGNISYAFVLANANTQSLGSLPRYAYCRASAVNNSGAVAASSYNLYDHNHAFIWRTGEKVRLAGLPGFHFTKATAINNTDQVVGYVENGGYYHGERKARAALWNATANNTRALDLGTLGGRYSAALAINSQGDIAGKSDTSQPHVTHACLWRDGKAIDLGVLPGGTNSLACAIDDYGRVVGDSETTGAPHAFEWNAPVGQMNDLGVLPRGISSHASAVNSQGQIVGQSVIPAHGGVEAHAVIWQAGHIYDLNRLVKAPGWLLEGACAITSSGQIAGVGFYHGQQRVFVLTPALPQPAGHLAVKLSS